MTKSGDITELLQAAADGEPRAMDALMDRVYADLERLAEARLRGRFGAMADQLTLEPSALVHETFLKLVDQRAAYKNRRHFFAIATRVMMRALGDYQRARNAGKRHGRQVRVTLTGFEAADPRQPVTEVPDLLDALERLEALDARKAEIVKLRGLWGLTMSEVAEVLGASLRTVERDWRFAKAWIAEALTENS